MTEIVRQPSKVSTCLIQRLPVETLGAIFVHCAQQHYSGDYRRGEPVPTVPSWVSVSYVSRHWRNVALNCPALWSHLFIKSPRWTEELLARSKQTPLAVCAVLYTPDRRALRFLDQVLDHLERIQELGLYGVDTGHNHILSKLFDSPAPLLRVLDITALDYRELLVGSPARFCDYIPALRKLRLLGCTLPRHSLNLLDGLTSLSLLSIPAHLRHDTPEFLAALRCMPRLANLHLDDALSSATSFLSDAAFHRFQKTNLPLLSTLSISAPLSTVIALLSLTDIPLRRDRQTVELLLNCEVEREISTLDEYAPLCSLIAQRFHASDDQVLESQTIRSLAIGTSAFGHATFTFIGPEVDRDCFNPAYGWHIGLNAPFQITLPFGLFTPRSERDHIVSHVCCPAPWPNVQGLHVLDPPHSLDFWIHVLGHLPALRHLKLSKGWMLDLVSILSLTLSQL